MHKQYQLLSTIQDQSQNYEKYNKNAKRLGLNPAAGHQL